MTNNQSRRKFLTQFAAGSTVAGLSSISQTLEAAMPIDTNLVGDADEWLTKGVKGKHKIAYDGPEPHNAFPIIWTWAYYLTNNQTGTPDEDMTGVCVLRHNAIPYAMKDDLWSKYKFGEAFKINQQASGSAYDRNPAYMPQEGDFPVPGIDGIKALQDRGAMFCVCDLALTVMSGFLAQGAGMTPEAVKEEWVAGLHPGIQLVPSGVWALGRAQELGCGYIYAGG